MAEYVSLLPPNSHGEANPADKDPVPPPFDNTYNSPEHDAFVLKVKYQRNDAFFTGNMVDGADRARLEQAWNDLFGSWPYHDAYLGMLADHYKLALEGQTIKDMTPAASRRCRRRSSRTSRRCARTTTPSCARRRSPSQVSPRRARRSPAARGAGR